MEDVWHANLTCRGHTHVPGNISSIYVCRVQKQLNSSHRYPLAPFYIYISHMCVVCRTSWTRHTDTRWRPFIFIYMCVVCRSSWTRHTDTRWRLFTARDPARLSSSTEDHRTAREAVTSPSKSSPDLVRYAFCCASHMGLTSHPRVHVHIVVLCGIILANMSRSKASRYYTLMNYIPTVCKKGCQHQKQNNTNFLIRLLWDLFTRQRAITCKIQRYRKSFCQIISMFLNPNYLEYHIQIPMYRVENKYGIFFRQRIYLHTNLEN